MASFDGTACRQCYGILRRNRMPPGAPQIKGALTRLSRQTRVNGSILSQSRTAIQTSCDDPPSSPNADCPYSDYVPRTLCAPHGRYAFVFGSARAQSLRRLARHGNVQRDGRPLARAQRPAIAIRRAARCLRLWHGRICRTSSYPSTRIDASSSSTGALRLSAPCRARLLHTS